MSRANAWTTLALAGRLRKTDGQTAGDYECETMSHCGLCAVETKRHESLTTVPCTTAAQLVA